MAIPLYNESKTARIELLNIENGGSKAIITFKAIYFDATTRTIRTNVNNLGGFHWGFIPKPIQYAEFISKVHIGFLKSDVRLIFVVSLTDGTVQLVQEKEGTSACTKLLALCTEDNQKNTSSLPKCIRQKNTQQSQQKRPQYTCPGTKKTVKPYELKSNEIPQGTYLIGKDIPAGTYDFFVVYGNGGLFSITRYDKDGNIDESSNYDFYWVGRKESYEHKELIHINCEAGYTIKIEGNVILKIAKSQQVKIEL